MCIRHHHSSSQASIPKQLRLWLHPCQQPVSPKIIKIQPSMGTPQDLEREGILNHTCLRLVFGSGIILPEKWLSSKHGVRGPSLVLQPVLSSSNHTVACWSHFASMGQCMWEVNANLSMALVSRLHGCL